MNKKKPLAKVYHAEIYGKREAKYEFLNQNSISTIDWKELNYSEPYYFFVPKDFGMSSEYEKGVKINEIFSFYGGSIKTERDKVTININKWDLKKIVENFKNLPEIEIRNMYGLSQDSRDWSIMRAKNDIINNYDYDRFLKHIEYRPFDRRYIYYTGNSKGFVGTPGYKINKHVEKSNYSLNTTKYNRQLSFGYIFISNCLTDIHLLDSAADSLGIFPLYLYPDTGEQTQSELLAGRRPNLNPDIISEISSRLGLAFHPDHELEYEMSEIPTSPNPSKGGEQDKGTESVNEGEQDKGTDFDKERGQGNSPTPSPLGRAGVGSITDSATEMTSNSSSTTGTIYKSSEFRKPGYITANPKTYKYIKDARDDLKRNPTDTENLLWGYLRNKKIGYKIRRQHIIDNFIVDFVCLIKKVAIEIDGEIHKNQKEYDELRTQRLLELGYDVIRFTNEDVIKKTELVVMQIKKYLDKIENTNQEDENNPDFNSTEYASNSPFSGAIDEVDTNSPSFGGVGEVPYFTPLDLLDYIYAVLHSPSYRERYKEFLKIDFPRVPYPDDVERFWELVKLGGKLRQLHLLESPEVNNYITNYPKDGSNEVSKVKFVTNNDGAGKVYINDTQYFDGIPEVAWMFYIGGYQPAQKWLKDRKGRKLEFDDIMHYQKIIVALTETNRIMQEIDELMLT